jgi:hypothetical protein
MYRANPMFGLPHQPKRLERNIQSGNIKALVGQHAAQYAGTAPEIKHPGCALLASIGHTKHIGYFVRVQPVLHEDLIVD